MRAQPDHRVRCTLVIAAVAALALALAAPAFAESPWFHLTSGSRPAYLHITGAAKPAVPPVPGENEVQKVTVNGSAGETWALANMSKQEVENGELECEPSGQPKYASFSVGASAAVVQSGLEGICGYGVGNVEVSGTPAGEPDEYEITFKGALADQAVRLVNTEVASVFFGFAGTETAVEITPGKAEVPEVPPVPDGEIYVTAENVGDANANGAKTPIVFKDVLPSGLKAVAITGTKPGKQADFNHRDLLPCSLTEAGGSQVATCTMTSGEVNGQPDRGELAPYDQLEMRVAVDVEPGAEFKEQLNKLSISGGGATPAALARPITISSAPVPFGVEHYEMALEEEGGAPTTQAGAHPFQLNTTIALNQEADIFPPGSPKPEVTVPALAKDLNFKLPPGLIGNPTPIPQCTTAQFFATVGGNENRCPPDTAVGVAVATVHEPATTGTATVTEPIFNLEPRVGEPARFGFYVIIANSPVFIDTSVRTGGDYGVTVSVNNITQTAAFLSSEVTFWGVPGDSRHDKQRGWGCLLEAREFTEHLFPCNPSAEQHPAPFLSLPTACATAMQTSVEGDSWAAPGSFFSFPGEFEPKQALDGCNQLRFGPEIKVAPDGQEASKPTGLSVDVHVPQEVNNNAGGLASSNVKSISVTFPEGVTVNPAAADGLQACSEGLVGFEGFKEFEAATQTPIFSSTLPEPLQQGLNFCPDASKIGTVKIKSPLLPAGQPLEGSLYLATPAPQAEAGKNPFNSLLAMYIIAKDPISGTLVKLPGRVALNGATGQLVATFEDTPQLAFEDAEIHLFGGERAPLATPASCGTKTTVATFTPWSGGPPVTSSSSFEITSGPNGSPCPNPIPFTPSLAAGTTNINAGSFTPLSTTISRADGNQDIQSVQLHMPAGLSGVLAGVKLCPEAQANAGSCPSQSEIGHTTVSVGLGGDPYTVTGGQVFLTEGYEGAPFGLSIVNPAVAGPFDLGKVIVRAKVEVDPHTAALTVTTNPSGPFAIPHILDGIPLQIKHVNVTIDRPGFTFNPTNCNSSALTGTIGSASGASAAVSVPFQVTNCTSLKFAPKFTASTVGKTSKASGASLSVKLSYPNAPFGTYANLARAKVSLPKQLPSRLTTLQKACTAAVFDANPAKCPPESIVGHAKVITPLLPVPLLGPAYFVSHGGEAFPDLTMVLQGYGVTVDLVGSTSIKGGVTTSTFKATPDVPFNSFELTLPQGKFSALAANANLCQSKLAMPSEFTAQNGALLKQSTTIAVTGCAKALTRAQKLAKALKACHKKKHAPRASCERQAKKKFAVKKQTKKAKKK